MKALAFGIVLAVVGLIGAYSYAHSAAVDKPVPATAERWKLQISILNKDGNQSSKPNGNKLLFGWRRR